MRWGEGILLSKCEWKKEYLRKERVTDCSERQKGCAPSIIEKREDKTNWASRESDTDLLSHNQQY
jgi:hypothetical protein